MKQIHILTLLCFLFTSFLIACNHDSLGACFNASDNNVAPNEVVTFTNCSNFSGTDSQCNWNFGDGSDTITVGSASVKHAFKNTGSFEVSLTIGAGTSLSKHTLNMSVF